MYKEIRYFYHITHIDNISSIINNGLYSKNLQKEKYIKSNSILTKHKVLSDVRTDNENCDNFISISNKRDIIKLNGLPLNNYVPLYFNPECAILNIDRRIEHDFVVICISKDILNGFKNNKSDKIMDISSKENQYDSYFSNGIPTNPSTQFFIDERDLININWQELLKPWNFSKCFEGLNSLMPEVLVKNKIQTNKIEKIICGNHKIHNQLKNILGKNHAIKVEENRRIYFMSGYSMETEHIFNIK